MIKVASITKLENGSIVTPKGFSAIGTCKWSEKRRKKDLGAIVCDVPASCAAVYTTNQIQAAPLQVTKDSITAEGSYKQLSLIVEMQMLVLECKDYKTHTRCALGRNILE